MKRALAQSGFSLIEMIVALAVFASVVTIAIGALLILITTNQQLQAKQGVMTNLSFALDSMTREIRTGSHYFCGSGNSVNAAVGGGGGPQYQIFRNTVNLTTMGKNTSDCVSGRGDDFHGLAFIEGGQSVTGNPDTRIVYFFDGSSDPDTGHKIYRRISGEDAQSIVSSGIYIKNAEFFVSGSEPQSVGVPGSKDKTQAAVTILIEAKASADAAETYVIETTVTQRTLDI